MEVVTLFLAAGILLLLLRMYWGIHRRLEHLERRIEALQDQLARRQTE